MTKAITFTYTTAYEHRSLLAYTFAAGCCLMAFIYIAGLYGTIAHTVSLQRTQSSVAAASAEIGSLDATYLHLSSSVTPTMLASHGFVAGQPSAYISRSSSAGVAFAGGL